MRPRLRPSLIRRTRASLSPRAGTVASVAFDTLPGDLLLPTPPPPPSSGIPFTIMNLDANDPTGASCRGRIVLPLKVSDGITQGTLASKLRVLRNGVEVSAYIGTIDTTDPEWGGGIVHHHDASRDTTTGRFTEPPIDRPLLCVVVEVDCTGLARGASRNFVLEVNTPPTRPPLTPRGFEWAENALHLTVDPTDPTHLRLFPVGIWPTSWGKRVAPKQGLEPTPADAPVFLEGIVPNPEGGALVVSGTPASSGTITTGLPLDIPPAPTLTAVPGPTVPASAITAGTYYVAIAAQDKNGDWTPVGPTASVTVNTGDGILVDVAPPPSLATKAYRVYIGSAPTNVKYRQNITVTSTSADATATLVSSVGTSSPVIVNLTGREIILYRVLWRNSDQTLHVARTPGHVDNAGNSDYWYNDVMWLGAYKLTLAATNFTFTWGTTPLDDPNVTIQQGIGGVNVLANPYPSAANSARVSDLNRIMWMDTSNDADIMYYDSAPHWPKVIGWCTDADYLCATNFVEGLLPKAVTDTWGQDYIDTDYTLRRHIIGNWGQQGRFYSAYGNAHYNPQRVLIAEHFRTAHPYWMIVALAGVRPYDAFWGARNNYDLSAQDRNATVGLSNLYLLTDDKRLLTFLLRCAGMICWRFITGKLASSSTRYMIKPGNTCLWMGRLNCWPVTGKAMNGVNLTYANGYEAFNHAYDLVRNDMGKDGVDGTATAHPGFLSDFGSQQPNDFYDDTHRHVRIPHKTAFAEGLTGEASTDVLVYCGGNAPLALGASLVTKALDTLRILGEHAIDMETWRGTKPWIGEVMLDAHSNVQDAFNYVSDENGGQRYVSAATNNSIGGNAVTITHRWDPTLNAGLGDWTTDRTLPLTHGYWESPVHVPYVVGAQPLQRPRSILNGLYYELIGELPVRFPTHPYVSYWRSIHEMLMRHTTQIWMPTGISNAGIPYYDINNGGDGPYYKLNKTLGESWCGYGFRMRDFAIARGLPTSLP